DHGQWLHQAVFLADVEVSVDLYSQAQPRPGTILGPVFYNEKKKRAIGASGGCQVVCIQGARPSPVRPPHPSKEQPIQRNLRHAIGYRYQGIVLESLKGGKATADTRSLPKFTDGFDTGRVGMAWNGSVQCFLYSIRIEGRLDPDWVAEKLKETGGPKRRPGSEFKQERQDQGGRT
ncbi:MAG: hypothetical protein ACRD2T_11495, partial [Thermoanaerobaculia bacterium]